jgi:glutathione S-transferase
MLSILGRDNSINVRKVLWTCAEIGLPFTLEPWGAGVRATQEASFLTLNPNGLVPVMRESGPEGDFVLWESNTICRYLAAEHGRDDLLPSPPRARAQVEQWMDWMSGELNNAWRYAFMALVRKSAAHGDATAVQASIKNWNHHMTLLDAQLSAQARRGSGFVVGTQFTLADVLLGLATHRWMGSPIERSALPAVSAYYERLSLRPAFAANGRHGPP